MYVCMYIQLHDPKKPRLNHPLFYILTMTTYVFIHLPQMVLPCYNKPIPTLTKRITKELTLSILLIGLDGDSAYGLVILLLTYSIYLIALYIYWSHGDHSYKQSLYPSTSYLALLIVTLGLRFKALIVTTRILIN
ncbi:hypothetical protein F4814DRAFT_302972 [Daldinia grandis]|nr:hypothetical protein F4814DRAFT_302972 [Daldinia grandis]